MNPADAAATAEEYQLHRTSHVAERFFDMETVAAVYDYRRL